MKNYYFLEHVSNGKIKLFGTYTNLSRCISDANNYLRGYNYALMKDDFLRIVTHENMEIRRYGYRYDNVAYKWKMNNHIFYTDEQLEAYKKW